MPALFFHAVKYFQFVAFGSLDQDVTVLQVC